MCKSKENSPSGQTRLGENKGIKVEGVELLFYKDQFF